MKCGNNEESYENFLFLVFYRGRFSIFVRFLYHRVPHNLKHDERKHRSV